MLNMKYQYRLYLFVFLLFTAFTQPGCSKKAETEKAKVEEVIVEKGVDHPSTEYVSLIQKNTDLIKTVNTNVTSILSVGIEETDITYIGAGNVPMAIFLLKVDLSDQNIIMEACMPNDKNAYGFQTVRSMITAKNASYTDREVIAATNGDYFNELGVPLGMVYRNGVLTRNHQDKYYFLSILKDNTCVIGDNKNYISYVTRIKEGLGARYLLVKDAELTTAGLDENVEPRTAVGVINSKKLVFLIVDGRRTGYSAGITLADEAKILKAIGVRDAVNLDGGGSSTFIVKNIVGGYETRNRPSGDVERAVANSWMIMRKK
ncbi:hypothetical protein D3C87_117050 [compost metagenome]